MPWDRIVGEEWAIRLQEILHSNGMQKLMEFVVEENRLSLIYPKQEDIFKAFRLCPFDKMKVIILGQDPYHDGSATGLAFANSEYVLNYSPSLQSIWQQCEKATETISIDFDCTLESWARQGVLLLNTALTVKKYDPTSHSSRWHPFTKQVLKKINEDCTGLHVCLWGTHAKEIGSVMDGKKHFIYTANHPIAHVYNKANPLAKWECNHFREINNNIILQNGEHEIIAW